MATSTQALSGRWRGAIDTTMSYNVGTIGSFGGAVYYAIVNIAANASDPSPTERQGTWRILAGAQALADLPNGTILYYDGETPEFVQPSGNEQILRVVDGIPDFVPRSDIIGMSPEVPPWENTAVVKSSSEANQNNSHLLIAGGRACVSGLGFYGELGRLYNPTLATLQYQTNIEPAMIEIPMPGGESIVQVYSGVACHFAIATDRRIVYGWGLSRGRFGDGVVGNVIASKPVKMDFASLNFNVSKILTVSNWNPYFSSTSVVDQFSTVLRTRTSPSFQSSSASLFWASFFLEVREGMGGGRLAISSGTTSTTDNLLGDTTPDGTIRVVSGISQATDMTWVGDRQLLIVLQNQNFRILGSNRTGIDTLGDLPTPISNYNVDDRTGVCVTVLDNGDGYVVKGGFGVATDINEGALALITPPVGKIFKELIVNRALNGAGRCGLAIMTDGTLYAIGNGNAIDYGAGDIIFSELTQLVLPDSITGISTGKAAPSPGADRESGFHLVTLAGDLLYIGHQPEFQGCLDAIEYRAATPQIITTDILVFYVVTGWTGSVADFDYSMPDCKLRIFTTDGYVYMTTPDGVFNGATYFTWATTGGIFARNVEHTTATVPLLSAFNSAVGGMRALSVPIQIPVSRHVEVI